MLGQADRKAVPVGFLDEIQSKAKVIAMGEVDVVTEEEDDENSQVDNDIDSFKNDIDATERETVIVEEAKNIDVAPQIEDQVKVQIEPIEEDLTTPEAIMHIDEIEDWEDRMNRASYSQ